MPKGLGIPMRAEGRSRVIYYCRSRLPEAVWSLAPRWRKFWSKVGGLEEVVEEPYLRYRIRSTAYLADKLIAGGVPIVQPAGGHAIYIDARALLPHVPPQAYPGISVANALYVEGGVRGVEIGTVMFGLQPDGTERPAAMDLVRLAIPRRVYTQSHIDYVAEVVLAVAAARESLRGYRITSAPAVLRHFTATFA